MIIWQRRALLTLRSIEIHSAISYAMSKRMDSSGSLMVDWNHLYAKVKLMKVIILELKYQKLFKGISTLMQRRMM